MTTTLPVSPRRNQTGLSLIELMLAMAMGVTLLLGVSQVFSSAVGANTEALRLTHVTQEVRAASNLIVSELRRAGYWLGAQTVAVGTAIPYGVYQVNATCVLYSYDDVLTALPYRGFRLEGGAIKWMRSATLNLNECTAPTLASWTEITETASVNVTALAFADKSACVNITTFATAPNASCNPCDVAYVAWSLGDTLFNTRQVGIAITASPAGSSASPLVFKLQDSVLVRNEEHGSATAAGPAANTGCGAMISLLTV
ncbi:MAG: prepilin-type N-terminal cleavage/methylation domain-containing protein [Pseudomonadota bacterium]